MSESSRFPEHLRGVRLLGVQDLAAQREDRLRAAVAALLGRAARRVALDDEELGRAGVRRGAVRELARQVQPVRDGRLARDLLSRAARLSRAGREDDPADDLLGDRRVLVQPLLERGTHGAVHGRGHLRVVEAVLRLALELRLKDVGRQQHHDALADVLRRDAHALRQELVRLDVVADGLREARAQAVLVRAARRRRDPVHERADVLVRGFRPDEGELEARVLHPLEEKRARVRRRLAALRDDVRQPVREAALVRKLLAHRRLLRLVREDDTQPAVKVRLGFQPLADLRRVERELAEDLDVGPEAHDRPRPAHLLAARDFRDLRRRLPLRIRLLPRVPVALDRDGHLRRERADDGRADAVEAARVKVVSLVELPARVQRREDELESALLVLRVDVDGDAAAVVRDLDLPAARKERDVEARGIAVDDLVDRVVDDLVDEVVETARVHAADVHAGALADGLEAFEDGDVAGGVGGGHEARRG